MPDRARPLGTAAPSMGAARGVKLVAARIREMVRAAGPRGRGARLPADVRRELVAVDVRDDVRLPTPGSLSVCSPSGYRIDGLTLEQAGIAADRSYTRRSAAGPPIGRPRTDVATDRAASEACP